MDATGRGGAQRQDEGLPVWVLPVCLVLAAVACALLLRFAVGVMSEEPATPTPSPPSITARP